MIAYLSGVVKHKYQPNKKEYWVILLVKDVGYRVLVPKPLGEKLQTGGKAEIYTFLSVREDAQELFGFSSFDDLEFFRNLVSIPGIGPRSALNVISAGKVEDIKKAAVNNKPDFLSEVLGLGPKTAQKVVTGLQDKFAQDASLEADSANEALEVLEALVNLGYTRVQAREALKKVKAESSEEKLKEALKLLGKK